MFYLDLTLPDPSSNLALDEALLEEQEASQGAGVLRVWELQEQAVVLGASSRLHEDVRVEECKARGVRWFRRGSGGGTVVIGPGALNFAVVLPLAISPRLAAVDHAQEFVLETFAQVLRGRGSPVKVRGSGDLVIDDRKCAGSAQRRAKTHFLVHFTVLYGFPLEQISQLLGEPKRRPEYRGARSHADFLINLAMPRAELIAAGREAYQQIDGALLEWDRPLPRDRIQRLLHSKYDDLEWINRF